MSDNLRSKVIRLAHANPALRPHLLPLLKEAASKPTEAVQKMVSYIKKNQTPFKIQSFRGGTLTLKFEENDQIDRVEIKNLHDEVPTYRIYLKNGMSGWQWLGDAHNQKEGYRFWNNPGRDDLWDRNETALLNLFASTNPERFESTLNRFLQGFSRSLRETGWVWDSPSRSKIKYDDWVARNEARKIEMAESNERYKALVEKARNEAKAKPASLPDITKPANYWTRELTRDYLNMEEVLRASGDANGLRILDSFGSLASRPGVFESMSLERLVRYIDDLETRVKDNPSGPHAILSLDESLKDMSKRVRRGEIPGSDSDEDFYDREPRDEDEEDRDDDY